MSETLPQVGPAVTQVANVVIPNDLALAVRVVKEYQKDGAHALIANAGLIFEASKSTFEAVQKAIPEVKAGNTTSEYKVALIVTFLVAIVNGAWMFWKGEPAPADLNAVIGGLAGIYIAGRSHVKAKAAEAGGPA